MEHGRVVAGKPKVLFVLGATATGKSKLAIALAERFNGEVINADKIQVHDGVPIITNKVTEEEKAGVPHHLLSVLHPDADFTADEFRREAAAAVARVLSAGRLPVVAGGSNTYIEALVQGDGAAFRLAHDLLFVWVDAEQELLEWYMALRVDEMVARGLVEEARAAFDGAAADYTHGVRRAIGLPEMHAYLAAEREGAAGEAELAAMLGRSVREIKGNTFRLARTQTEKIRRLSTLDGWDVRRLDVTPVFARKADGAACHEETWRKLVWGPCEEMVRAFLEKTTTPPTAAAVVPTVVATGGGDAAGAGVVTAAAATLGDMVITAGADASAEII
ncbi:Adenylate isopentenyltransferase 3, chloroplastic [Dichanthelium oligosanthes]|uniref:adenylate dimethylallyltransferase (ADP/ATP-dependent) n=1 Tax=Dichanthelium oligosanthes TaxID=888268 RepID=A0A1E5WHP4_9POAL|nr:Adenylate isopentenyltransferase 3, chloroplastic [Dichanthelium oligosanthes]